MALAALKAGSGHAPGSVKALLLAEIIQQRLRIYSEDKHGPNKHQDGYLGIKAGNDGLHRTVCGRIPVHVPKDLQIIIKSCGSSDDGKH